MAADLAENDWVLPLRKYHSVAHLEKLFPKILSAVDVQISTINDRRRRVKRMYS
jgi:hypothetical protein